MFEPLIKRQQIQLEFAHLFFNRAKKPCLSINSLGEMSNCPTSGACIAAILVIASDFRFFPRPENRAGCASSKKFPENISAVAERLYLSSCRDLKLAMLEQPDPSTLAGVSPQSRWLELAECR